MSSQARRLQLKILRQKKLIPQRHKATRRMAGTPYRHCLVKRDENGDIVSWKRYH